jgi:hypothetical protein
VPRSAVEQRLVDRLVELAPAVEVDAVDEQVGVEGGLGDEGQHLAVARVDGHQRAAAVAVELLHQVLQLDVDRQVQLVAGVGGWLFRRRTARPLAAVSTSS